VSEVLGTLFKYLLAVLAIGAVVLIFYEGFSSNKVGTEASNITSIQASAAQLYAGQSNTTSLSAKVLIAAGSAPNSMVSGTTLVNPWGGAVTVTGDATDDIIVSDSGLSQTACAKLVTSVTNFTSVAINGGTAATPPVDPSTVSTGCVAGTANKLVFTFNS
jgi:hypothetical protein